MTQPFYFFHNMTRKVDGASLATARDFAKKHRLDPGFNAMFHSMETMLLGNLLFSRDGSDLENAHCAYLAVANMYRLMTSEPESNVTQGPLQ
jgi:hypothetical protein